MPYNKYISRLTSIVCVFMAININLICSKNKLYATILLILLSKLNITYICIN